MNSGPFLFSILRLPRGGEENTMPIRTYLIVLVLIIIAAVLTFGLATILGEWLGYTAGSFLALPVVVVAALLFRLILLKRGG